MYCLEIVGYIHLILSSCLAIADNRNAVPTTTLALNDGNRIPNLGLGTWLGVNKSGQPIAVTDDKIQRSVEWAIDAGYRHIDTAYIYSTEKQVGRAVQNKIAEGLVTREDLYITTKLWSDFHAKDAVVPALKESLWNLDMEYVDLYLIHLPVATYMNGSIDPTTDYIEAWEGMIEAQKRGLTKSIGVSNFNQSQIERIIRLTNVKPSVLQNEINLSIQQPELLAYCRNQNIVVTAYTPFGSLITKKTQSDAPPPQIDEPALVAIAQKYNKTVPQITLRYLLELGVIPIPKSVTKAHLEENIQIFDFSLTDAERKLLSSYDKNYTSSPITMWASSPYYPF